MQKLKKIMRQLVGRFSSIQMIVIFYFIAVVVAAILLSLPIFRIPGQELSFLD